MNVKYGILKKQMLNLLEKQSMVSNGKNNFEIWTPMAWFICLIELSKIYYIISFHMKYEAYKRFKRSNNNIQHFEHFQSLQNLLGVSTETSKERYYSRLSKKLMEPSISAKTYWSVLRSFHNNKKWPVFHQFFTEIDLLQISKKKPTCLTLFLLSNVQS